MGRRLNHATPTVVNTELIPFDESFFIGAEGQLEQWYYDNTTQYAPNRRLSPLILTPHLSIFDKETGDSYSSDAESASTSYVAFYTVMWYALEYVNDGYVESVITNLTDSAGADYVISGNSLIVKKNVSYSHGVTIRCVATYKDPRDANNAYTTQETVLLTTNRDAKVDLPEVSIISPSARGFNPLTDYKTVDGVEVQDSLFDFDAVVSNKPTVEAGVQYRVDGGGTEEIVEEEGVMTALPSMDIRYPDSDVMLDQSFLYRVTANGTKPNVNGAAFVTALRGNTVKWNELMPENKRNASKSYSADATYYVSILAGLSITITESHKYYGRAYVTRNISDNNGINFNFNNKQSIVSASNGSPDGLKSAIVNATSSFVATYIQANNYAYKHGFSAGDSYSISNITYIDLTEMFGTDAQIAAALGITTADITTATGVTAFEAWLETNLGKRDYYPYDAGSLVPTRFSAVKTVSFNIWDGTYSATNKYINVNGDLATSYSGLSVTNFIKVLPDTDYYISIKSGASGPSVCFYDESYQYISGITHTSIPSSKIFHTPVSTCYIKTTVTSTPPCINISIPSKNGTSGQHWESTAPLPITSITGKLNGEGESVTVFPDGMKRVGNVYDEIKVENGVLKAIKRVGSVDLGTLTWTKKQKEDNIYYVSNSFTLRSVLPSYNGSEASVMLIAQAASYGVMRENAIEQATTADAWDKYVGVPSTQHYSSTAFTRCIWIKNNAYADAASLKTSLNGEKYYYAINPNYYTEYVLDPFQDPYIFEWFGMNGSQEVRVETLPWYVSGQGTPRLTVDAMFGEHINVVATAKTISGQPTPSKAYAAVEWRVPDMDINVMSKNGGAVRSDSTSFYFEPICNMNGQALSGNVKNEHLRFNWKYRKSNSTVENNIGWGATKTIAASNLLNTKTVSGTLPSTHVYSYAYLLGAWTPASGALPAEYTRLEYLESTGTQYIQTNYTRASGNTYKMEVDLLPSNYNTNYLFSIGADYIGYFAGAYNGDSIGLSGSTCFQSSGRTLLALVSSGVDCSLTDGSNTVSYTRSSANYSYNPILFARYTPDASRGSVRIYSAKIYKNNSLEVELVPAMRDSDSVVGMYDLVGNTFLTNAGTGTFGYAKRLPYGYTELEYLESDGNQWMDTGFVPTNTTGFYVDIQKTVKNSTDSVAVGVRQSSGNTRCIVDIDHSTSTGPFLFGWNSYTASANRLAVGLNRVTAELNYKNSRKCVINGTERSGYSSQLNSTLSSGTYSLYLFALNRYGAVQYGFVGKVWSIQITSGSDIVHDYIPAMRNSDRVAGMYDLVSDTFLTNAGTGEFKYEIKPTDEQPTLVKDGIIYTRTID